mmetsp:Transcript_61660/g.130132  ORF Transcript_61660/g.130132 Transcript_61660/m.130132 type:complete len:232 (-) Transcript_61660:680-1375(-)
MWRAWRRMPLGTFSFVACSARKARALAISWRMGWKSMTSPSALLELWASAFAKWSDAKDNEAKSISRRLTLRPDFPARAANPPCSCTSRSSSLALAPGLKFQPESLICSSKWAAATFAETREERASAERLYVSRSVAAWRTRDQSSSRVSCSMGIAGQSDRCKDSTCCCRAGCCQRSQDIAKSTATGTSASLPSSLEQLEAMVSSKGSWPDEARAKAEATSAMSEGCRRVL